MTIKQTILTAAMALTVSLNASAQSWPQPLPEAKAGVRWWWFGSAVDQNNLNYLLGEYSKCGIGAVEITPIYGIKGNEQNDISFLSPKWMQMLNATEQAAKANGIEVDMNTGTGWPFGGPEVPITEAACKAVFVDTIIKSKKPERELTDEFFFNLVPEKEKPYAKLQVKRYFPVAGQKNTWRAIAVYASRTRQKVKRPAPGGEGWVIDHFDSTAVAHYLDRFTRAFTESGVAYPHTFFNDSYEVYGADWSPTIFDEFYKRRGYHLEDRLPQLLDRNPQTVSDYRETLSDMLYHNFTQQWASWAHSHGALVRNQAHGSPANLLDLYGAVDIPEIEGFGLSNFGIRGLRTDPGFTRKNYSDVTVLKYASSAAHVMGKQFTSSETFTWLTEHFRTSLSQMKPDLDLMFSCGVNHVFFHGTPYSPREAAWPGWQFYASVNMSPTNSTWRDAPELMKYIERCQSFLQWGQPDNDFLVYLPVRDMWKNNTKNLLLQFDIHKMGEKAPDFIKAILELDSLGFDCDYISDRQLAKVTRDDNGLTTEGGTHYRALLDPRQPFNPTELAKFAEPEELRTKLGLRTIRRKNPTGHHYFIANLTPNDVDGFVSLAVNWADAVWFDPLDGRTYAPVAVGGKIRVSLKSGQSMILQTYDTKQNFNLMPKAEADGTRKPLNGEWTLSFTDDKPHCDKTFNVKVPTTWETLADDSAKVNMGTGIYTTHVNLNTAESTLCWAIDLGDVRESARVYVNGKYAGCAWSVPYVLDCCNLLHKGDNEIRIEVTNLPANRIADYDRRGVNWRIMKDINVVDINYKTSNYSNWAPMKSGLNSEVALVEMR